MEMIRRDDTERAGRMRYLYEADLADAALYDPAINTDKLTAPTPVEMLARAVGRAELRLDLEESRPAPPRRAGFRRLLAIGSNVVGAADFW
jgi:hypothetical protein